MKIYRIENKDGRGFIFCGGEYEGLKVLQHHLTINRDRYPTPLHDSGIRRFIRSTEVCGAWCLELLIDWVSPVIPQLVKAGFDIVVYECPEEHITIGERQLLFVREYAKRIS